VIQAAAILILANTLAANAQDAQRITIVVGFTTGGIYDATARLWSRHLGDYLPNKPTVVVQNMPGAGSMVAANNLYNVAARDGSVLGVINGATVFEPLFGNPAAKYDPQKFSWIGGRTPETALCVVWHTAKATTFAETLKTEITVGGIGPGSRTNNHPAILNALLGTKLRIVNGYPGGAEITLAMERGEVDGFCGWAWGAIKSRAMNWVNEGKMKLVVQTGIQKIPELPNVPFALDMTRTPQDHALMTGLMTDTQLAWPLIAPPALPDAKLSELRRAFDAMMRSEELLKDAEKMQLEVDPVSGKAMQETVQGLFALPPDLIEKAKAILK
jgi:tripartite-type tricarboxylate transporter receptor subunit TctC